MSVYAPGSATLSTDACEQVREGLRAAGFPAIAIPIMVAIARAESGCRSAATCRNCGGVPEYSVGPFQINLQAHPWVSEACARDPMCASRAALRISGGSNFTPWTTYTSGRYRQYLDSALGAVGLGGAGGGAGGSAGGDTTSGFTPASVPAGTTRTVIVVTSLVLAVVAYSAMKKRG